MEVEVNKIIKFATDNGMSVDGFDGMTGCITVGGRVFMPITDVTKLFKADMSINVQDYIKSDASGKSADYVFEFGGNYYWSPLKAKEIEFNDFRYIGSCKQEISCIDAHLGVHGGYEIMNGTGPYSHWCSKAKFLGHKYLGICEKDTLAGAVAFQIECLSNGIKPVIGMSFSCVSDGYIFQVKAYVLTDRGWKNLLRMHKHINVDNDGGESSLVPIDMLKQHSSGLCVVLGWGTDVSKLNVGSNSGMYYQIDTIVYDDVSGELDLLNNVKTYIDEYMSVIPPILINDTYYIDKDYSHIKTHLNKTSGVFHKRVSNAHYKNGDETFLSLCDLFKGSDDRLFTIFELACDNLSGVCKSVDFKVETGVSKLPVFRYVGSNTDYASSKDNNDLIWKIIEDGLSSISQDFVSDNQYKEYYERLDLEMGVISRGGFVDYFLTVWDIIKWSFDNGIYTGLGRGSAGGSLVAYLMGITKIDPIQYNLPFERFMNEGRLVGSLPDIDSDFEGLRRQDVKRYMEERYGVDYVCSVGSYSKLRVKAAMNEMWVDKSKKGTITYMTAMIMDRDGDWSEIFRSANKKPNLKDFVQSNVGFINNVRLVLDQPKNQSIHAGAVVIVPNTDAEGNPMTIFDWIPVTKRDGVLISEWEGAYIEKCGFLKNDILGTRQLDKFRYITDLIKETTGDVVDIYSVPTDDEGVMEMFRGGYTEDTFHFGTGGLKSFTHMLKPNNVEDLIDTISLHRPALMDIGMHKEFVNIRFGRTKPHYDFMLEGVTAKTNGILIYQEQVMEAVKIIGGFTMQEADDVRRAMGKKKIEVIAPYKTQFVNGAMSRGLSESGANELWNKLELFSGYGFNRAHATAYALTGYVGMWFKVNYPLQFWTAAFQYASDEDIPKYMSEMRRVGDVHVVPPDINVSGDHFTTDYDNNLIHWSLIKIKQVGGVAVEEIVEERNENGKYYDIEEFFSRVTRKKVNRKVITSLIFAGCMDKLHGVSSPTDRIGIMKKYADLIGEDLFSMVDSSYCYSDYWWVAKQKMVSGLGVFDFQQIADECGFKSKFKIVDASNIQLEDSLGSKCSVGGLIVDVTVHRSKNGEFANVCIDSNDDIVWVTIWSDTWSTVKDSLSNIVGKSVIIISGKIVYNSYRAMNTIETYNGSTVSVINICSPLL